MGFKTSPAPEQAVIGTMMIDRSDDVTSFILGYLDADDFSDMSLREVFSTMKGMYAKKIPIDLISVCDIGGHDLADMSELAGIGFTQNCRHYAKMVKTESYRHKAVRRAEELIRTMAGTVFTSPDEVVEMMNVGMEKALPALKREPERMDEIIEEVLDVTEREYNDKSRAIRYGFRDLDAITGGLRGSEITIIGAGPGTGKTAFMMHAAANVARQKKNVLVFSREMSRVQVAKRVISNVAMIESEKIRDGRTMSEEQYTEFAQAAMRVRDLPLYIDSKTHTIEAICNKAMRYKEKGILDALCIDYFQLLNSAGRFRDRRPELEHVSRQLKILNLELDVPIVLLSQINRDSRKDNKPPELHDLRETGALEQDADNVVFLWNPSPDNTTGADQAHTDIEVLIRKQRNGRTGKVKMRFDKVHQRFLSLER